MTERFRSQVASIARRRPVLIGLLLLAVGIPEVIIGHTKADSYRERAAALPVPEARHDPTQLYPQHTAADEKRAVAEAKIGYYELLRSAGGLLVLVGLTALGIGLAKRPATGPDAPRPSSLSDPAR